MAIKIAHRAEITPEFITGWKKNSLRKLNVIKSEFDGLPEYCRSSFMRNNGATFAHLTKVAKGDIDLETTKLRSMPYDKFGFLEHNENEYLCGLTRPVLIDEYRPGYGLKDKPVLIHKWDLGRYLIFMNVTELSNPSYSAYAFWHFVPERNKLATERHMHHKAYPGEYKSPTDYLAFKSATCWGGFGSIIISLMAGMDVVELFRIISTYLNRYDPHSPLIRGGIDGITFKQDVKQ